MAIIHRKCPACGIETRAEDGSEWIACACRVPYEVIPDEAEAPPQESPPP